jgi:hypothetical protein
MLNSEFSFILVYDGEDLDSGSIDARDLAPALLAFADLVDQSGRVVVPEMPRVTVRVQTGFRKGSFDIGLELAEAQPQRCVTCKFKVHSKTTWPKGCPSVPSWLAGHSVATHRVVF